MLRANIAAISYWLPKKVLTNEEINLKHPEWTVNKISEKTGIFERHIASEEEFVSDLAYNAAELLFKEHKIDRQDIDFLLLCTQSPDYFLPTTACILQHKLGLSNACGALDFNLGCSGYIYGLALAKGLLISGVAKNVLLITAETYSKFIHENDKSNKTIFGDGAAATLVSSSKNGFSIMEFSYGTDGSGSENLILKNGGVRFLKNVGVDITDEADIFIRNDNNIYMNGGEIFKFTSQKVPLLINDVLVKNSKSINEIDLFIFHQANKYMLDFLRKKIGIDESKFFYYLQNCGNTVSSTIPIALREALRDRPSNESGTILLAGFGVGYSWGSCLIGNNI